MMQASTLVSNGTIYTLDFGDPLRITHLAHMLIEMSGLRPNKDIKIQFVGVRPGEKLHEQLWYEDSRVTPTAFARVLAVEAHPVPRIEAELRELEQRHWPDRMIGCCSYCGICLSISVWKRLGR